MLEILRHMMPLSRYPYRGERITCPVCESPEAAPVSRLDRRFKRLPTVMCRHCGLLFTNPMPTELELAAYYAKFYRLDYQLVTRPSEHHRRKRLKEARRRAAHLSVHLAPGSRILDFGCGSGEFVESMLEAGHDAHGFEPGESYAADAISRLGGRVTTARWQDMSPGPVYDLVTCFHVLEHLRNPLAALRAMVGWLQPGGRIYVEVPNMSGSAKKGFGAFHFAHVLGFNGPNLRLAGGRCGLRIAEAFAPTGLLFERGDPGDLDAVARQGLEETVGRYGRSDFAGAYWTYQRQKIAKRLRFA